VNLRDIGAVIIVVMIEVCVIVIGILPFSKVNWIWLQPCGG